MAISLFPQICRPDSTKRFVQRDFHRRYWIEAPTAQSIRYWYTQFDETGRLCKGISTSRPVSDDNR